MTKANSTKKISGPWPSAPPNYSEPAENVGFRMRLICIHVIEYKFDRTQVTCKLYVICYTLS